MSKLMVIRRFLCLMLLLSMLSVTACATGPDQYYGYYDENGEYQEELVSDPLEGWNRIVFAFNDFVITYIADPIRIGYEFITPQFVQTGISNFFHNLRTPIRFVSNLFQGKLDDAGVELGRFMVNTVAGVGGLIDVAEHVEGLERLSDNEDIGQMLGKWGIGEGVFIVWPLLGPSNIRDTIGLAGDFFLDPVTYVHPWELRYGIRAVEVVDMLPRMINAYNAVTQSAIDPYSAMRDAYIQNRRYRISE